MTTKKPSVIRGHRTRKLRQKSHDVTAWQRPILPLAEITYRRDRVTEREIERARESERERKTNTGAAYKSIQRQAINNDRND